MKKITQLLLLCTVCMLSISSFAQNTPVRTSPVFNAEAPIFTESTRMVACDGVLANYTNANSNTDITSQEFGAGNPTFSNMAADDFVVPAGPNAIICQVAIVGSFSTGGFAADPTSDIDMNIYADAGGLPGALVFSETFDPAVVDPDNDGNFILDPTAVPVLTAGATYWMSIVADMDFATGGQWFWAGSSDVSDNPAMFQNPGDGFGSGCTTWAPATICLAGTGENLTMDISFNDATNPDAPLINCPMDIMADSFPGECFAVVNFAAPLAIDPNGGTVTVTQTMGPLTGEEFPVGDTIVEFTATNDDAPNEVTTCQFTVTVNDIEPPMITCPDNITVDNEAGLCGATVMYPDPIVMDNCFNSGVSTVSDSLTTLFASDNGGGAGGAVYFDVTVDANDIMVTSLDVNTFAAGNAISVEMWTRTGTASGFEEDPAGWTLAGTATGTSAAENSPSNVVFGTAITLDANTTYGIALVMDGLNTHEYTTGDGSNEAFSNADLSIALGQANNTPFAPGLFAPRVWNGSINYDVTVISGATPYTVVAGLASGDFFPVGTTTNTLEYVDAGGNAVQCSFDVTVLDVEAPVIVCAAAPGGGNIITNGSFETGDLSGWTAIDNPNPFLPWGAYNTNNGNGFFADAVPTDGAWLAGNGFDGELGEAILFQDVTVPADATAVSLTWDENIDYDTTFCTTCTDRIYEVQIRDLSDNVLEVLQSVTAVGNTVENDNVWESFDIDLMAYVGQDIRVAFWQNISESFGGPAKFALDNVALDVAAPVMGEPIVILDANGVGSIDTSMFIDSATDNCGIASIAVAGGGAPPPPIEACGDTGGIITTGAPLDSTATVADSGIIGTDYAIDMVALDITHTFNGDLDIELISPLGTVLLLSDQNGGADDNYTGTIFQDGGMDITAGTSPFTGVFAPEGGTFAATFDGEDIAGDWILRVTDNFGGDDGTLDNFCMTFANLNASQAFFGCEDIGTNTIDIVVTDLSGNESVCTSTVTVVDETAPTLVCQSITVELDENGEATVVVEDLLDMALTFDACGIDVLTMDIDGIYTCDDIGMTFTAQVFASDASNNASTCMAEITVVDALAPVLTCPEGGPVMTDPDTQVYTFPDYFATGEASAVDNCTDVADIVTTQDPAPGTEVGISAGNVVTITATDASGNTSTCTFEVDVQVLGIEENELNAAITMYPNPANNQVTISNGSNIALNQAVIYDTNGKLINTIDLRAMQSEQVIDVAALASGIYMIQISSDNATIVKRLIKQ